MDKLKKILGFGLAAYGILFAVIGVPIGVVFIIVSLIMNNLGDRYNAELIEFQKNSKSCEGEIVESYDGHTTVYYEDSDGNEHETSFSMSSSELRPGKVVIVYYDKDHPSSCMVPDVEHGTYEILGLIFSIIGWGITIAFAGIGLIIIVVGIIIALIKSKNKENSSEENLKENNTIKEN